MEKKVLAFVFANLLLFSAIGGGFSVNIYRYGLETDLWDLGSYLFGLILEMILLLVVLSIKTIYSDILKRL